MPTKPAKQTGNPGKPSRGAAKGRGATKTKGSPSRSGREKKAKHEETPGKRKPKQAPHRKSPPQPAAVIPPLSPTPTQKTPATVQEWVAGMLEKLAWLAFEHEQAALTDMQVHREAAHPNLLHTARILQATVLATDLDDRSWLAEQGKTASSYIDKHRAERHSSEENRYIYDIRKRPQAVLHFKEFVIRKLTASAEDGRWPDTVNSKIANEIASTIAGDLFQDAGLAWDILPELSRDLNEESACSAISHEVRQLLKNSPPGKSVDDMAESIVRRALVVLGYRKTNPKDLFSFEHKALARRTAGLLTGHDVPATQAADDASAEMQVTAETSDSIPQSVRKG